VTRLIEILTTKWTPIIRQWSQCPLLRPELVDPFSNACCSDITSTMEIGTAAADATTILLAIQASNGLAMSTNDLEYEPTYVPSTHTVFVH
jgi:hypothetical protein